MIFIDATRYPEITVTEIHQGKYVVPIYKTYHDYQPKDQGGENGVYIKDNTPDMPKV